LWIFGSAASAGDDLKTLDTGAAGKSGYHLLKKMKLGGPGGWDYLTMDSAGRRLFVSHATHVMVVDVDHGTIVGDIPSTAGVYGAALVPEMNEGFTSNGRAASSTIFDLKTLKILGEVNAGKEPDTIIYDGSSKREADRNSPFLTARDTSS
jgi:hypothetical protein